MMTNNYEFLNKDFVVANNGVKVLEVISYIDANGSVGYAVYPVVGVKGYNSRVAIDIAVISGSFNSSTTSADLVGYISDRISKSSAEYNEDLNIYSVVWNGGFIGIISDGLLKGTEYAIDMEPKFKISYCGVTKKYGVVNQLAAYISDKDFYDRVGLAPENVHLIKLGCGFAIKKTDENNLAVGYEFV